jgi:hypothetical protein
MFENFVVAAGAVLGLFTFLSWTGIIAARRTR